MGMNTSSGVGRSHLETSFDAGRDAATQALGAAGGGTPSFTIVYGTVFHQAERLLQGVRSVITEGPVVGSSTGGISTRGAVDEVDRVVGVLVVCSDRISARSVVVSQLGADARRAGEHLADALGGPCSNPLLMWYDPLVGANTHALTETLAQRGFRRVIGGGAGQPMGPQHRTYQYQDERVYSDSVIALAIDGDVELVYALTHGTEPLGIEMTVTASRDNIVDAIDGRGAQEVLTEQLGITDCRDQRQTANWALGLQLEGTRPYEGPITRAMFGVDGEQGLVFQAPFPVGSRVMVCRRTREAVYDRALEMACRLHATLDGRPPLALLSFECAARPRPFLGDALALAEVQQIQKIVGAEVPWLGMYAWGELAPIGEETYFHNYTFPLVALCEPLDRSPEASR